MKTRHVPSSQLEANTTLGSRRRSLRLIAGITAIGLAWLAGATAARAASGVWTNDASGLWSNPANWLHGVVADGSGNTADFTLATINTNTVTMDASHSLGSLLFGATGSNTTNDWLLDAAGGSVLTLAGGTPTVAVSNGVVNNQAILALPVGGTSGLSKVGSGTLVLAGANSYSGGTTVTGGTLKLTNSVAGVDPNAPLLYFSFDDVAGATVINQGSGGHALDGTINGPATIVPGAGPHGNGALAIPGGSSSQAYVLVNSAVVPFNVQGGAFWTVAFWFKTTTAGACFLYQGDGGWANHNTTFFLNQGGGNQPGNQAGGVSFARGWEKGTAIVNDGNWHQFTMTCSNTTKTIYIDGVLDALTTDNWGGTGIGGQVRVGGNGGGEGDGQVGMNGLMDDVYIYNRALTATEVQALVNTTNGPTALASALPDNSAVSLASGTLLDLNGSTPLLSAVTGPGSIVDNLASGTANLELNVTANTVLNPTLTNSGGAVSLTKMGNATLTIPGVQTYRGATVVSGGTLDIAGSLEPSDGGGSASGMRVSSGVVNFSGTLITNYNYNIGTITNLTGAFYQTAGLLKQNQGGNGANFQLGSGLGAYGYYYNGPAATAEVNEIGIAGEGNPSGYGQADIYGSFFDSGWITITRGDGNQTAGLPSIGILNIWPGSTITYAGGGIQANWGSGGAQLGVINMMGGTVTPTGNVGVALNNSGNTADVGILNLNGGALGVNGITGVNNGRVNFQGGRLFLVNNATITPLVTVFSGGGTLDTTTNGYNLTINQKIVPAAGNGVGGIGSLSGGAGYIAPPIVTVLPNASDTTGTNATAIAQINPATGVVTNVVITSPGVNYTATPTFVLTGGNPTTAAAITGAAPVANAADGGLTIVGSGTVTMNGGYSYAGPTLVLGAGLSVISSNVTPSVAGGITVSNGSLTANTALGATWHMGSLNLLVSNTLNLSYSFVPGNPTVPAITISGALTAAPTNLINITAFGMLPGQFPLIKYGTGTLSAANFANFGLSVPPGVTANLVNNTGNQSIDLNVASAPAQITWNGVNGTTWDTTTANWTNSVTGLITTYAEHNNGITIAGDIVTFDDTLTNDFVHPQPTNVNLTAVFHPFPITVNSTLPYSISGAGGITGSSGDTGFNYLTKNNTGSLTLLTANTFSGNIAVNGGSLVITNDSALGASANVVTFNGATMLQVNGNTTDNARALTVASGTNTIGVLTNVVAQFGGRVSGGGSLTKTDDGTLVLAGSNAITGSLLVHQGTLVASGGAALPARVFVGDGTLNGQLTVAGGVFNATQGGAPSILVGGNSGVDGFMTVNGGTVNENSEMWLATADGGLGELTVNGGAVNIGSWFAFGRGGGQGVLTVNGGTLLVRANNLTLGSFGGTTTYTPLPFWHGVANLFGGTVNVTNRNANQGNVYVGENTSGNLNVMGNAALNISGSFGLRLGHINGGNSHGIANLDGGVVTTPTVSRGSGYGQVNFNGGTVRASASSGTFMQGLNSVNIYGGGATIDDGGNTITIAQPLLDATNGSGIVSIPLNNGGGSGYVAPPIVTIVDGNGLGSNAMAVAQIDPVQGTVTNIIVTCPGSGFDAFGSFIQIGFEGGGAFVTPPNIFYNEPVLGPNGAGSLTKKGSGTATLTGANTFTGPITNDAGTLVLSGAGSYAGAAVNGGTLSLTTASTLTGPSTIANGAGLTIVQIGNNTSSVGDLTFNGGAATPGATLGLGLTGLNPNVALVQCGALTFNGTNSIGVAGAVKVGAIPLVHYTSLNLGAGASYANLTLPQGVEGFVSNSAASSTVYAVVTSTGPGLVWNGTNTQSTASTNAWDINSTTNWWLGAVATAYQQPIIPGDAVTFNDLGSGQVVLKANVGPSSIVISNSIKNYTFSGTGDISGPGGITKLGTATAILNLTNDSYLGDTVISNGTVQIGSVSTLPSTANLNIGPLGTLELNGQTLTVNGLSGGGVIDNNSASDVIVTVNNGGVWNGTIQNSGPGGVGMTKNNYNTLVIGGTNQLSETTINPDGQTIAGTLILTNNGLINCGGGQEYWIAPVGGFAATNIVDGGTLVMYNWMTVGRGSATAAGTLIVNRGTVQKAGGNNIVLGSLGSSGNVIVNGGQILNNGDLWLGESQSGHGELHLNGGLVQAAHLRPNNYPDGFPVNPCYAYFNGGTLQATANSADYMQFNGALLFEVMSNGLVFDDNGFSVSIGSSGSFLQAGDTGNGGLFKEGSGTLYLDTAQTYNGLTVVTNGTLAGIGSVASNVLVVANGKLGAGDAATNGIFTVGGNLTLQAGTTLRINKTGGVVTNDQVVVGGNIAFGGTLTINNITGDGTALVPGDSFQLFSKGGSGNFTSVTGPGATYSFNAATGVLTVNSIVVGPGTFSNPTGITGFRLNGGNVVITGTNGQAGDAYYLLQSTNVSLPLSRWSVVATNVLGANGGYTFVGTNAVTAGGGQQFYILSNTNNH